MLQQPLMLIFTALSVVQIVQGLRRVAVLRDRQSEWVAAPLLPWKRSIAHALSFYAAVPIGVFIHELGHAIVVWAYGGRVVEFGFFFFWGFVLPDRTFDPAWRQWVLSMAGTIGNLIFAAVVALVYWRHASASIRLTAKRTVNYQIYFSLIYYPIFTAVLQIGDWRTIYDFNATPMLAGMTAVLHVLILGLFWLGDRRGVFDESGVSSAEIESLTQTTENASLPDQINAILRLHHAGADGDAKRQARALQDRYPGSGDAAMLVGLVSGLSLENPSNFVIKQAKLASQLNFERPDFRAYANHAIGFEHWSRGDTERAIDFYSQAIANANESNASADRVPGILMMYYMRGIAHAALKHREQAESDINQAITIAEAKQWTQYATRFRDDLKLLVSRMN